MVFYKKKLIRNIISFRNWKKLISYLEKHNNEIKKKKATNISIAILLAITVYLRIYISNFKNLDNITLYYIVKGRLLVPDLVTCYSRDAQCDWIKCLRLRSREQKCGILKGCANDFSQRRKIQVTWNVGIG